MSNMMRALVKAKAEPGVWMGPAIRSGSLWPTPTLLELSGRTIIGDCGLGVARGMTDGGLNLKELDLIFITHFHSDHVLEIGLLIHTAWTVWLAPLVRFSSLID